jgi:hypothetical protein
MHLLADLTGQELSEMVECNDNQLDINNKGDRNLCRKSYMKPSKRLTKEGVRKEKVLTMVPTDKNGNSTRQVTKINRVDVDSIEKTIGGLINSENLLYSNAHSYILAWAKEKELEPHTFFAS